MKDKMKEFPFTKIVSIIIISSFEKQKKLAKLDVAIDAIRSKYGDDAIKRATFLNGNLDHMAGGISKEKKDGITKEV